MTMPTFRTPELMDWLLDASDADLDQLDFGVIGLDADLNCLQFSAVEQTRSGLSTDRVIGVDFFEHIAPCMNNFLVADRLFEDADVDDIVPYTLSVRVKPNPVELRLLARRGEARRFLLITWDPEQ
jgi:photoactive yellow protein